MNGRSQRHSGNLTSSIINRIIVGSATGMATYLITNLSKQPQIWVITLSVFTGGTVLVVQFLIGLEGAVREGMQRSNQGTRILEQIEASAIPSEVLLTLVENSARLSPAVAPVILGLATTNIERTSDFFLSISRGEAHYRGEDRDWLLGMTVASRQSIHAMHPLGDESRDVTGGFWFSDLGQRYLNAQAGAHRRQVEIRRIFLIQNPETLQNEMFQELCKTQNERGIEVRHYVWTPEDRGGMFDIIIFDNSVSYHVSPEIGYARPADNTLVKTELSIVPGSVEEDMRTFERIWDKADPWRRIDQ